MSEFEINLFGWLIVGLIIFSISIYQIEKWDKKRFLYRLAIERRLDGFTPNYDIVWRRSTWTAGY